MKKILFIFLLLCFCASFSIAYSQSISKSLFILIDRDVDSIQEKANSSTKIRYDYLSDARNWNLRFEHIYIPNDQRNHFRYLLTKEMVKEFQRKGNVRKVEVLMQELDTMNLSELNKHFKLRYSYFFEYLSGNKYKTQKRYNVFLFFKSDLEKDYIPFYEVSVVTSRAIIEEE